MVPQLLPNYQEGFVGGYEVDLLLMAISISLLLTGPGRISIEWNVLKRELFPKGDIITYQQQHFERLRSSEYRSLFR